MDIFFLFHEGERSRTGGAELDWRKVNEKRIIQEVCSSARRFNQLTMNWMYHKNSHSSQILSSLRQEITQRRILRSIPGVSCDPFRNCCDERAGIINHLIIYLFVNWFQEIRSSWQQLTNINQDVFNWGVFGLPTWCEKRDTNIITSHTRMVNWSYNFHFWKFMRILRWEIDFKNKLTIRVKRSTLFTQTRMTKWWVSRKNSEGNKLDHSWYNAKKQCYHW